MYTFQPLAAIPVSHDGLFIVCLTTVAILAMVWVTEGFEYLVISSVPAALVILLSYNVSYHWTDQTPKTFANVQVTGELVGFVAEGYNETRRSGKTTTHVDVHETYVVYSVNGDRVMLSSRVGQTYPERVVLYKN